MGMKTLLLPFGAFQLNGKFSVELFRDSLNDYTLIQLFNPSIGDYILSRYAKDATSFVQGMLSLLNESSLNTIVSLQSNKILNENVANYIFTTLLQDIANTKLSKIKVSYISRLFELIIKMKHIENGGLKKDLINTVLHIFQNGCNVATESSYFAIDWGLKKQIVTANQAISFIESNVNNLNSYEDIQAVMSLLANIPDDTLNYEYVYDCIKQNLIDLVSDSFTDFIDTPSVFSSVGFGEYEEAYSKMSNVVKSTFNDLGFKIEKNEISIVMDSYDVAYELEKYYMDSCDENEYYRDSSSKSASAGIDEIDDLFDRG